MQYLQVLDGDNIIESIKIKGLTVGHEFTKDITKGCIIKFVTVLDEPSEIEALLLDFLLTDKYSSYKEIEEKNEINNIGYKFKSYLYKLVHKNDYNYKIRPDMFTSIEKRLLDYLISLNSGWQYRNLQMLRKYYKRPMYDRDMEIFKLREEKIPYKDIASKYNISVNRVKQAIDKIMYCDKGGLYRGDLQEKV